MTDISDKLQWIESGNYNLSNLQGVVLDINMKNGWFESDRSFGDDIALLHTEVSEAFEAYRYHGFVDATAVYTGHAAEFPEGNPPLKPEGVGSELADVLVRLLDTCERYDIDLEAEFVRKCKYNTTRGHRHGGKLV